MATTEEIATDILWEEMKNLAIEQQQFFYEYIPDEFTEYKFDEHKYLKQNIGCAIYGSPTTVENTSTTENSNGCHLSNNLIDANIDIASTTINDTSATKISNCYYLSENLNNADADITDTVNYNDKAKKVIDTIYKQICECSIETDNSRPIYFSIIYNIIFRPKMKVKPRKEKKETKTGVQEETKAQEKTKETEDEKDLFMVSPVPIFKIRKQKSTVQNNDSIKLEDDFEIWFIDTSGRVYKSWKDYIEKNTLPKCTMIVPKGGFYQADESCPVTVDYSTVWLEIIESPACSWKVKLSNGIDILSSAVGFGTAGLCVASLFTPLAPVVAVTGLVATGATGVWTIGRCSQQLVDRSKHEESIHLWNKEAFSCWLGIAGSAVGLSAAGGTIAISRAAANGMKIPTYAGVAFNTVQGGNIILNGIGVVYQGYCMIDKYRTGEDIGSGDVLNFMIHIMFFAGSVVKVQFAGDIIENTQGKVINDYKESLRSRNLRKKFNRTVRKAAENNTCKISENTEVIRYIRNRQQLLSIDQPTNGRVLEKTTRNIVWSVEQGKLRVNGIILLDPIDYVRRLIQLGIFAEANQSNLSNPQNYEQDFMIDRLIKTLCDLLSNLYQSSDCPKHMPTVPDFEPLIKEMSSMNVNEEYLKMVFTIAERLIRRSKDKEDFLLTAFIFVWQYCKANLRQWGISSPYRIQSDSGSNILRKIITAITEAIDMMLNNLFEAFVIYLNAKLRE